MRAISETGTSSFWEVRIPIPGPPCSSPTIPIFCLNPLLQASRRSSETASHAMASPPPTTYNVQLDQTTGKTVTYAVVSLVENNAHTGRVLLLAGQSTSATELAGEFLLRSDSVVRTLRKRNSPAS